MAYRSTSTFCSVLLSAALITGCANWHVAESEAVICGDHVVLIPKNFNRFEPTTVGLIRDGINAEYWGKKNLIQAEREQFQSDTNLLKYLKIVEHRYDEQHDVQLDYNRKIRESIDPIRDQLFYYDYQNGDKQELGWMIIEGHRFKQKFVLAGTSE